MKHRQCGTGTLPVLSLPGEDMQGPDCSLHNLLHPHTVSIGAAAPVTRVPGPLKQIPVTYRNNPYLFSSQHMCDSHFDRRNMDVKRYVGIIIFWYNFDWLYLNQNFV